MQLTPLGTVHGPVCSEHLACSESLACGGGPAAYGLVAAVETLTALASAVETLTVLGVIEHGFEFLLPSASTFPGATTYPGEYGTEVGLELTPIDTGTLTLTPLTED